MNHAALLLFLCCGLVACGGAPPRAPAVSVGSSPTEVAPLETPAPAPPPVVVPAEPETSMATPPDRQHGLFLTDGQGQRYSVETIRTNSPATTR